MHYNLVTNVLHVRVCKIAGKWNSKMCHVSKFAQINWLDIDNTIYMQNV